MSASRKAKKYAPHLRHWHGVWEEGSYWMTDELCYRTHREKLPDSRRRRMETVMRRVKRKDLRIRRDVRKSRLPVTQFFSIDVSVAEFLAYLEEMRRNVENLRMDPIISKTLFKDYAGREFGSLKGDNPIDRIPSHLEFAQEMKKGLENSQARAREYWQRANPSMGKAMWSRD